MYKHFILTLCILSSVIVCANGNSINQASDSLRENAVAIVQNSDIVIIQSDMNNATCKVTKTMTILSKQGEGFAHFYAFNDKFREMKDFSAVVKNASGSVIRKIGKKDLTISSMSDQMATDAYSIVYEYKIPTYPYTIEYTYEEKWKNGIISYPAFTPIQSYMQSLVNASYRIELPVDMNLRYDANFDCNIKDEVVGNKHIYSFTAHNLKAINSEPLAPALRDIYPRVLIAPADFCYDSSCGNMSDWKNYGTWVSGLLKGRDTLPNDIVDKLKSLVKDAKTDREKVEILFKYLQENSRYVSIQLGIGGFQPIEASNTMKTGFGDCKGLSNEMKAMLNAIGIPSNYCEIYSGNRKSFTKGFSNISETNHAILLVPLQDDSLWLECTSQTIPFGYIHDDIAGHDALVVTENGGKICRVSKYQDKDNKQESIITINVSEDGTANGTLAFVEHLHGYFYNVFAMTSKDREKVIGYINRNIKFPKVQIDNISTKEDKSSLPSCSLSADFVATDFVNKTGTRLFIPACPLEKGSYNMLSSNTRIQDIVINNGFSESDSIIINIPESYTTESLPKNLSLTTPFGKFETEVKQNGNKIIYIQNIDIFTGRYDKSQYKEIKAFFAEITAATKRKLVLRKS
ncbi:DUF3857 domain-containing protein [Dysgonomonas sp. GY75]|uniref:DUF3857 domain-containing protein n=1 Tax=Dysgonomonas sp. GY75 TaxID=2780419 RepID=UPI0018833621|nr:DUF3857 domain-containing protein [Dysgonomonas sp. GY75]MBF0648490.1 DUF3857 domain-containing protein [Dysgonomonas sp. GY75]